MWRIGVVPNMNRATIITVGQLAAYDTCKELFVAPRQRQIALAVACFSMVFGRFRPSDVGFEAIRCLKDHDFSSLLHRLFMGRKGSCTTWTCNMI